jgi:multicomponent Na+:H+ antiporter subunit E
VVIIAARMDKVDGDSLSWSLNARFLTYIPWLAWQILRANIDVMRLVLSRDLAIDPQLEWVSAGQKSDLGIAVYANSITLTPGTISTSVEDGRILVHALTREGMDEVRAGAMDARVRQMEG